jgi:hypothetical protein
MNLRPEKLSLAVCVALGVAMMAGSLWADEVNLVRNPSFEELASDGGPAGYELSGSAVYRRSLGDPRTDVSGPGVVLETPPGDSSRFHPAGGSVSQTVLINPAQGRALSFRFRGLPQDEFSVAADGLYMKVEFFGNGGQTAYDGKVKQLFPLIEQARRDLTVNGDGRVGGAAVWRDYVLNFYVPFPQVDRVRLTVASQGGGDAPVGNTPVPAHDAGSRGGPPSKRLDTAGRAFFVSDFSLTRLPEPAVSPAPVAPIGTQPAAGALLPLGGRWFYAAKPNETRVPALFDHTNSERLLYRDGPEGRCETPFVNNMSATLHPGNIDLAGNPVTADRLVPDNVTVRFEGGSLIVHTHGLPNHATGRFPEDGFGPGRDPSPIEEQDETYYIPVDPKVNPAHVALSGGNNRALNMGPIALAVNGVVFFNPFDAFMTDASNIMDRCCGHPNQDGQYHYHKYPICLNSPWADEGKAHSPLIGFAFDGFPIYGPYEAANVMAKDVTGAGALNAFNLHYDPQRGWHYHVTPGKFPYVLGGYWGQVDSRNVRRPRPRGDGPPPFGGPPPDGGPPPPGGPPPVGQGAPQA